jgi:ribose/xylose/arabinose/galactoside ABC-type transport system permease subunit
MLLHGNDHLASGGHPLNKGMFNSTRARVNETYLSARNLSGMLALVATLAIVAYGQQALMLVGGIDLSVGPLMGLMVVIQSFFLNDGATLGHQLSGWVIVFVVGLVNWVLVGPFRLHPMVATLATYMALQAVSLPLASRSWWPDRRSSQASWPLSRLGRPWSSSSAASICQPLAWSRWPA